MSVYHLSYDLNKPSQDYANLYAAIKSLGGWAKALDSTWLVDTNLSASQIYDRLKPFIDANDLFFVSRVDLDNAGWLRQETWDWFNNAMKTSRV